MHFRFLDLAPELRNRVYEQALTHDRANGTTATVGLLRTCRQVYAESKGILYAESTFTISVKTTRNGCEDINKENEPMPMAALMGGDVKESTAHNASTLDMFHALPSEILDVPRLHVDLDLRGIPEQEGLDKVNHWGAMGRFLYSLAEFLNSNAQSQCRELTISSINKEGLEPDLFGIAIWPLSKIHRHVKVEYLPKPDSPVKFAAHMSHVLEQRPTNVAFFHMREYDRLRTLEQSFPRDLHLPAQENIALARRRLDGAAVNVLDGLSWVSGAMDMFFRIDLIAVDGLLHEATPLHELLQPPKWLVKCYEIGRDVHGKTNDRDLSAIMERILIYRFGPLEHFIRALFEQQ